MNKRRAFQRLFSPLYLVLLLAACSSPDSAPPAVSISTPAVGQGVTGTVQIQLSARDDSGISRVAVYARGRNTTGEGVFVGSATSDPFVVSWATAAFPNQAELEIYAKAEDATGNFSQSDPVWVKTNNSGVPTFSYLIAYTLPPVTQAQGQSADSSSLPLPQLDALATKPPVNWQSQNSPVKPSSVSAQNTPPRAHVLRFGWNAVQGASGYRIWQADGNIAGPYKNARNQLAVGSGIQEYQPTLQNAKAGDKYFGAVTAVVSNSEGGYSNADGTAILPAQLTLSPADGATAGSARPTLQWSATEGVQGYLWYVSRKTQSEATPADWVCTNFPNSTDRLEATYPASCPALTAGNYFWWVAGVGFSEQGLADAYTFSDPMRFVVP